MSEPALHVVTGAFGYSGRYIAERLLASGHHVRTLTNSGERENAFQGRVEIRPLDFKHADKLAQSLRGASVLYNTYWVRFNHKQFKFADAVRNTQTLFKAAMKAGVPRVVHVSITNPSENSPLEYFSGKATLERSLRESGLSYAVLRPTVLFGGADILINNIAWALRRFPVFGVFGKGDYRLQPMHVQDFADLAIEQGRRTENAVIDGIGPETFTYRELVKTIGEIIGCPRPIMSIPPWLGCAFGAIMGKCVGDVMITRDEIAGLMGDLLYTQSLPAGQTRLTDWARDHADTLGQLYASELARRRDRKTGYEKL